ncbi:hypothetical protein [Maribacter sp. 2308TA10-17]|uniref:hypothetical protein n=1 Tax=Maribacter sp. 2308TA10-17 TaxID=3386276 RepID=UPI0039BC407A
MNKNLKKQFINVLLQTLPVIFGIFLALYVNQNEQIKKDRSYVNSLLQKSQEQIVQDSTQLSADIKAHLELSKLFSEHLTNPEMSVLEIIQQNGGLNITPNSENYLNMFVNSKIEHLQISKSSQAFEILELLKGKERYEELIQQTIYEEINSNSEKVKMKLMMIMNDYGQLEKRLLNSQIKFLNP